MIKLEMLRVFQAVAEAESLARASAQLHRTPSALSMTLAQLEEELGAPLFETRRKSRLTPFGARILEEAINAVRAFDRSTTTIRRHAQASMGLVRIAAVPSATIGLLPPIIARYQEHHPGVRLEVSDVNTDAIIGRVKADTADIGIVSTSPGAPSPIGECITLDALGIVYRKDGVVDRMVRETALCSWHLLEAEPLIDNSLLRLIETELVATLRARASMEVLNTTALLAFVEAGLGATVLPCSAIPKGRSSLRFVVPNDPASSRELRKIRNTDHPLNPAAQALWTLIQVGNGAK